MALTMGIVGLPNVGKSTVFNALTEAQNAEVANYPFCTIQPNQAVVPVPDSRLDRLAALVPHDSVTHATLEFVDIAGLVQGASKGEGLGNQFLGNIRDVAAIVHVVRCFTDPNVVHVSPTPEPRRDVDVVNLELMLSDLQQIDGRLEKLERQVKGDRGLQPVLETALALKARLEEGEPVSTYAHRESEGFKVLNQELRFLSGKPVIFVANVDESDLASENDCVAAVRSIAQEQGAEVVVLCAQLEAEMVGMAPDEKAEYLDLAGVRESGLAQVIRRSYHLLGLISFFTTDSRMLRAWTVRRGATAPQAAGVIHSDFARGFIRAEVVHWPDFDDVGSEHAAKSAGLLHIEGRDYVVQDGDVIHFRFNV